MKIPPIKEDRIKTILEILKCIDENKFNRDKMRDCILELYPNKSEKSVFRGMAIPTLRRLGLILGYNEFIRPSSDGQLLIKSTHNEKLHQNVLAAVFLEIDKKLFKLIEIFIKLGSEVIEYLYFVKNIEGTGEYIKRWLKILSQCGLINIIGKRRWEYREIFLKKDILFLAEENVDYRKKKKIFKEYLFKIYEELPKELAGIIDIESLRGALALKVLKEKESIITEKQFDCLLREIPLVSDEYIISLGQSMGAEEKLFELNGKYYNTLSIYK